jgi:MoaA/NifB/PqqE/SkfB family radical SAM enzyme
MKDWLAHQPGWAVVQKESGAAGEGALSLKSVDVHVTHACDHDCDHCFAFSSGPHLSVELFDKAQQLAKALGIRTFQFCGGEPTLNPRMLAMAEMAKAQGFQIILRTHGRLLSQLVPGRDKRTWAQEIARIFDEDDEVTVSVDGLAWENFLIRASDKGKQAVFDLIRETIATNQGARDVVERHISNVMQERGYGRETEVPVRDIIEAIQGLKDPKEKARIMEEISNQADKQYSETMDGLEAQAKESARRKDPKVRINSVVARDNVDHIHELGKDLEERVAAGKIRLERWSITHVAPAPIAKKGDPERYSIDSEEFMAAAIRCSDASPNISKRVKIYQGEDDRPDCLTVRPKLLPIVRIKERKAGEQRKIITAEAFIERGEIVIPIDNLEQTPIRTLVERINDAAARIRLGDVRHAGQLQYAPDLLIKALPEHPDIRPLCGEYELKDASRGDGSVIHLMPKVLGDIIEQKAHTLRLTERQKASLMSLADAALAPEDQTGFGGAKFRNLNFALIQERLKDSDAPAAFYIRSDCADLKRLNYIFSGYNIRRRPTQEPIADRSGAYL